MVAERVVAASCYGDGTAEIPQLEKVGFDVMRNQFGEDETEIKRGVFTLTGFFDDETGYSCDVNVDVSEVFFNSCCQQHDECHALRGRCSGPWTAETKMVLRRSRRERR